MTTQHTPGPWKLFGEDSLIVRPGIEATLLDFSVVMFGAADDDAGVRGRTPEEADANARLIAAAPDLLESLNKMLVMFGKPRPEEYVDGGASYQLAVATVNNARDTIKKATGLE